MADNVTFQTSVTATPPNATTIATDEISGAHYQLVKLNFGDNGTAYTLAYGTPMPIGTLPGGTFVVNGTPQVLGSVSIVGTLAGGSVGIVGTIQVLGTVQTHGTSQVLGTVQTHGTSQMIGTVQAHGTNQALGTVQPLAGSVHPAAMFFGSVQGWQAHDAAASGNPVLLGAFGSSGTQTAVNDGDTVRLAADLLGRLQIVGSIGSIGPVTVTAIPHVTIDRGTIDKFDGTISGGTIQAHGTTEIKGTVQTTGTVDIGTVRFVVGTVNIGTMQAGSVYGQGVIAHGAAIAGNPLLMAGFGSSGTQAAVSDGQLARLWTDLNGRLQIRGTIDSMPAISVSSGTIPGGTIQAFGTTEVLGTVRALTTVNVTVGTIAEGTINDFQGTIKGGTIQVHGTAQVLGTVQPLAGSVHPAAMFFGSVQGFQAHDGAVAGNPVLIGGFGSSGTQAAVADGDTVRAWFDLNGRLQTFGTIGSITGVTITTLPAVSLTGGTIVAVGSAVHGAAADTRPLLMSAFGSSGTQAAVDDGDAVRLWADLNGRLQVRGTIDSIPNITITAGTVSLNTGGTVHVGSVQSIAGTVQALGTVQPLAGSVHVANVPLVQGSVAHDSPAGGNPVLAGGWATKARPGTVAVDDAARFWTDQQGRQVVQVGAGTSELLGTVFTGAGANGTILAARGAGSFWRIHDILLSGSAAGTFAILQDTTLLIGPLFIAANGGWSFNSAIGIKLTSANTSLVARFTAGTWAMFINYSLEGM